MESINSYRLTIAVCCCSKSFEMTNASDLWLLVLFSIFPRLLSFFTLLLQRLLPVLLVHRINNLRLSMSIQSLEHVFSCVQHNRSICFCTSYPFRPLACIVLSIHCSIDCLLNSQSHFRPNKSNHKQTKKINLRKKEKNIAKNVCQEQYRKLNEIYFVVLEKNYYFMTNGINIYLWQKEKPNKMHAIPLSVARFYFSFIVCRNPSIFGKTKFSVCVVLCAMCL